MGFPCYLHGGDRCFAMDGEHREHSIFEQRLDGVGPPVRSGGRAARAQRNGADEPPRAADRRGARLPSQDNRDVVALDYDEVILDLDVPQPDASTYLKAADRQKWALALVGVAAARFGSEVRLALCGVAPIPGRSNPQPISIPATPLPGNAYKVQITTP